MNPQTVTTRGRAAAEARMIDACTIRRGGGAPTFDAGTGEYTDPAGMTIYSGPCEIQLADGLNATDADVGGTEITRTRVTLKVPMAVTGVREDDVATIDSSVLDAELVGQEFRVLTVFAKTFATARRFQVERINA